MKNIFTQKQRLIEVFTILTLITICVYMSIMWNKLPQQVPLSFHFNGEVSSMGSKSSLLIKLVVCFIIYIVFSIILFNPSLWGINGIKNKKKQKEAYLLTGDLSCFLKLILITIMVYIIFCSINNISLGRLFILVAGILPLAVVFNTSAKIKTLKNLK